MKKILIRKSNTYDIINSIYWTPEILKESVEAVNNQRKLRNESVSYYFDETDGCVYYGE